jgi:hypothetical protein
MHELLLHEHATRSHPRCADGILPAAAARLPAERWVSVYSAGRSRSADLQSVVSQVFNLPPAAREQRYADYKSAIREIKKLRYDKQVRRRQHVCRRTSPGRRFMLVEPDPMENGTRSTIQQWLRKKAAADAAHHFLFAVSLLSVGAILLAVTFFFACVLLWVALNGAGSALSEILWNRPVHLSLAAIVPVAAMFVAFLFIESARVNRQYLTRNSSRARSSRSAGRTGGFVNLLVYSDISSRLIADGLLTGPRLMSGAWCCFRKAGRLSRLDAEAGSRVLAVLFSRASRCSLGDLSKLSGVPDPGKTAGQLRDIDGVLFIHLDPPGLTLTSELRQELAGALDLSLPLAPPTRLEPKPVNLPSRTIFELLGVAPTASPEEIEVAYRNWMQQSCARQAAELENAARNQQLDEQVAAVNRAYEAFLAAHESGLIQDDTKQVENVWEQFKRSGKR